MRYKLFSLLGVAAIISIIGLLAPVLLISRGKLFWMSSKQQDNGMSGDGPKEPTLTASAVSNVVAGRSASNFTHVFMDTNVINQSFSLVTDPQSGQYATVSADVGSVVLRDKSGKVGWSNNIAALANQLPLRDYNGKIDSIFMMSNALVVHVGNGFFKLDKQTGQVISFGAR